MSALQETVELLGGQHTFDRPVQSMLDLHERLTEGLPAAATKAVAAAYQLKLAGLSELLGVAERTLQRKKPGDLLGITLSDRLFRMAHALSRAEAVLGERERAIGWLKAPNRALGGYTPVSLLQTEAGTEEVLAVLGRIEHGVFS